MCKATRQMDELNRIVLPAEVKNMGWSTKTPLDITVADDGTVQIRAHAPFCKLCGSVDSELYPVGSGAICEDCLAVANEAKG